MAFEMAHRLSRVEESRTLAITARAKKMQASGLDVVSLSAGEPDFPTPEHAKEAAIQAIRDTFTHYTAASGTIELRRAVAEKFRRDNGLFYTTDEILISAGGKHSIANVLFALLGPGDEAIIPSPYWVSYPEMVKLADAEPVLVHAGADQDYKITPEQLRAAITPRTRLFILNSPSNPTGMVYSEAEQRALAEVLIEHPAIFILSDEIYEHILYGDERHFSIARIPELRERTVTMNGVSKAYAMTGWRIGFIGGPRALVDAAAKVQSQTTSNPSSIAQVAAEAALSGSQAPVEEMRQAFAERRDLVVSELNRMPGICCVHPGGAFYAFPDVSAHYGKRTPSGKLISTSAQMSEYLLDEHHLAVVPGEAFGAPDNLRLSYAASTAELTEALRRLRAGLEALE